MGPFIYASISDGSQQPSTTLYTSPDYMSRGSTDESTTDTTQSHVTTNEWTQTTPNDTTTSPCPVFGSNNTVQAQTVQGFSSNGRDITFSSCDTTLLEYNHFLFYVNFKTATGEYDPSELFDRWMNSVMDGYIPLMMINNKSQALVPTPFLFSGEMYFSACGGSRRFMGYPWPCSEPFYVSLGLPFYMTDECASNPCLGGASCMDGYQPPDDY
jgi:hypothetical protein